ncbi:hypothetical protein [Streptomyces sp. NRRL S-237]|uniref:hypothetical protein n=1 Tax=Streptomyces sp. NRRL S-237 TaxID=1463895 RepID=UPI00068E4940|nr:hypothetical protein [Streptomyces sp. NRRL S-237]
MRDRVWEAVEELPDALRPPLLLRHFTERVTAYDRNAQACGVAVGTVRSRQNQAQANPTGALAATADRAHSDARMRGGASRGEARHTLAEAAAGHFDRVLTQRRSPDIALMNSCARWGGRDLQTRGTDGDPAAGVRLRDRPNG